MPYVLGIDLGTTYTAVATYRDGRAQIVSIGTHTAAIPSVVFLRQDDNVLTGEAADRRALSEPARVAREFKRRVGDTTPIMVGGTPYSAEQLSAHLLRSVVEQVAQLEGAPPDHVAVCHPANWGPYKKELLVQTVELADITDPTFVTEPEAAAVYYASTEHVEPGQIVAVYDLGGGTFDAAVLRKTATGFETLGEPQGIERLGGIDFDAAVLAHVRESLGGALDELDMEDPTVIAAAARLREECVAAKEALSSDSETSIPILLPNVMTEVRLTRGEFESMIRPTLTQTIGALQRALRSAGVQPADISRVLLVGGSSRIPLVAEMVSAEFGRPVATDAHPKHAIALGAAITGAAAVGGATTAEVADATAVVATPDARAASAAGAAPAAADWLADPSGRHEYRYWDGTKWTDSVSDGGTTGTDPFAPAASATAPAPPAAAPPGAPPAPRARGPRSKAPLVAAAAVVVLVLAGIFVATRGGGGGSSTGLGEVRGHVAANKAFVHQVKVPAGSVLLVKVIPDASFDPTLSLATDFTTIEKFKTTFGFNAPFGRGAVATASNANLSDIDVSSVKGGIFDVVNDDVAGKSEQLLLGAPFEATIDVVVTGTQDGDFTLQTEAKDFAGPPTDKDQGAFYMLLANNAYSLFRTGQQDISNAPSFDSVSDFTNDSDLKNLSDQFSSFSEASSS